jgi:hypothetical protein
MVSGNLEERALVVRGKLLDALKGTYQVFQGFHLCGDFFHLSVSFFLAVVLVVLIIIIGVLELLAIIVVILEFSDIFTNFRGWIHFVRVYVGNCWNHFALVYVGYCWISVFLVFFVD